MSRDTPTVLTKIAVELFFSIIFNHVFILTLIAFAHCIVMSSIELNMALSLHLRCVLSANQTLRLCERSVPHQCQQQKQQCFIMIVTLTIVITITIDVCV